MDFSNLKLDDLIVAVAAMLAALPGLIALWQNKEQKKADKEKTGAEAENIHAEVADKWAKQVDALLARITKIETELAQVKSDLGDWQDWAQRLVNQVKALGHKPVPFKN